MWKRSRNKREWWKKRWKRKRISCCCVMCAPWQMVWNRFPCVCQRLPATKTLKEHMGLNEHGEENHTAWSGFPWSTGTLKSAWSSSNAVIYEGERKRDDDDIISEIKRHITIKFHSGSTLLLAPPHLQIIICDVSLALPVWQKKSTKVVLA